MSDVSDDPRPRWRARLDEVLDATGTTPVALALGTLAVGVVVGVGWWLARTPPPPTEAAIPLVDVAAVTTTTAADADGPVVVHVAGAVVAPGVQVLPAGARVADAVAAAGGLRADADADRINLAAVVVDGSQVLVPVVGEPLPVGAGGPDDGGGPVDLNTADAALLETLPGIGPATATAIVDHRERNGPFRSVEDLLDVRV